MPTTRKTLLFALGGIIILSFWNSTDSRFLGSSTKYSFEKSTAAGLERRVGNLSKGVSKKQSNDELSREIELKLKEKEATADLDTLATIYIKLSEFHRDAGHIEKEFELLHIASTLVPENASVATALAQALFRCYTNSSNQRKIDVAHLVKALKGPIRTYSNTQRRFVNSVYKKTIALRKPCLVTPSNEELETALQLSLNLSRAQNLNVDLELTLMAEHSFRQGDVERGMNIVKELSRAEDFEENENWMMREVYKQEAQALLKVGRAGEVKNILQSMVSVRDHYAMPEEACLLGQAYYQLGDFKNATYYMHRAAHSSRYAPCRMKLRKIVACKQGIKERCL